MDLEEIERLANDLAFGRTRYSFDHSKLGCDLLKMIERIRAADELANKASLVEKICDEPWGELEASVWTIEEDNYMAWHCRDLLFDAVKKYRKLSEVE